MINQSVRVMVLSMLAGVTNTAVGVGIDLDEGGSDVLQRQREDAGIGRGERVSCTADSGPLAPRSRRESQQRADAGSGRRRH